MIPQLLLTAPRLFYGEVDVHRHLPHIVSKDGFLDDEYDTHNPQGSAWGRRNYGGSAYQSGMPTLSPGEYPNATQDIPNPFTAD